MVKEAAVAAYMAVHPAPEHFHHRHVHHDHVHKVVAHTPSIDKLQREVEFLRSELSAVRAQINRKPGWDAMIGLPLLLGPDSKADETFQLASLPDMRLPAQAPSLPLPIPVPEDLAIDEQARVREAIDYLIRTATPGYTMARQGASVAIGRLHPAFAVKLAEAIRKAREQGLGHAGVFSAYRPPAFGVGGFSDKFNSLHSYGLAADVAGIDGAGSHAAHLWDHIVRSVGLFLPYGPNNRAEFNHTQLVPAKRAAFSLRATITAKQPKELRAMWVASGVKQYLSPSVDTYQHPTAKIETTQ